MSAIEIRRSALPTPDPGSGGGVPIAAFDPGGGPLAGGGTTGSVAFAGGSGAPGGGGALGGGGAPGGGPPTDESFDGGARFARLIGGGLPAIFSCGESSLSSPLSMSSAAAVVPAGGASSRLKRADFEALRERL